MDSFNKSIKKKLNDEDNASDSTEEDPYSNLRKYNFEYIKNSIYNGAKLILERDVVLGGDEWGKFPKGIEIKGSNIIIDGQGHTIDARYNTKIFTLDIAARNITIKNVTLKNGSSRKSPDSPKESHGGAIYNSAIENITFENVNFINNSSSEFGGAISNRGILHLSGCKFEGNDSGPGGAIYNWGDMVLKDCCFKENRSSYGGAICNIKSLELNNCDFEKNGASRVGGAIDNKGKLSIYNSVLINNRSGENGGGINNDEECFVKDTFVGGNFSYGEGGAIYNSPNKKLDVRGSEFLKNRSLQCGGAISNEGMLELYYTNFKENGSDKNGGAINNHIIGFLKLRDILFSNNHAVEGGAISTFDHEYVDIKYCQYIENQPDDIKLFKNDSNGSNFSYINNLIRSGIKNIVLESDITLDMFEKFFYSEGIVLDVDDLIIDGNGHSIDACHKTRIFKVKAKNVILKNIVFKNGYFENAHGGAIYVEEGASLEIIDSCFNGNWAYMEQVHMFSKSGGGGAIYNLGKKLRIVRSKFIKNYADIGGAVYTEGENIELIDTKFIGNLAVNLEGGAISNRKSLISMNNVCFSKNSAKTVGGAIYSEGKLRIEKTKFFKNFCKRHSGGAISNWEGGEIIIKQSTFADNHSILKGGAISNLESCSINIIDSKFMNNTIDSGEGATFNNEGEIELRNCVFTAKYSNETKGDLANMDDAFIKLFNCRFTNYEINNELILNKGKLQSTSSFFSNNSCKIVINNLNDASTYIMGNKFENNKVRESAIYNDGHFCAISDSTNFKNNISLENNYGDVINKADLRIGKSSFEDNKITVLNEARIEFDKRSDPIILENIENKGEYTEIFSKDYVPDTGIDEEYGFYYLDNLIHQDCKKEIRLEHDIKLNHSENEFYEGGIELDVDGLIIDGGGNVIDANGNSRIFIVTGKNITLKNIIFKNGSSHWDFDNIINSSGGAFRINFSGDISIVDCRFIGNSSPDNGGAIQNYGTLKINNDEFCQNNSKNSGGGIFNKGIMGIYNSSFNSNTSNEGGAIYNDAANVEVQINNNVFSDNDGDSCKVIFNNGNIISIDNKFEKNGSNSSGNVIISNTLLIIKNNHFIENSGLLIQNYGRVDIDKSQFLSNDDGPVIENYDDVVVNNSQFHNNVGYTVITNFNNIMLANSIFKNNNLKDGTIGNSKKLIANNVKFQQNTGHDGGAISNSGIAILQNSEFIANDANKGGAVYNSSGQMTITDSQFNNNNSKEEGGAIYNYGRLDSYSSMKIENVSFSGNSSNKSGGAIYNYVSSEIIMKKTKFDKNLADSDGGAIYNEGLLNIEESMFLENYSSEEGGAINNWSQITCIDSTFKDNKSNIFGGAINNQVSGKVTMKNSRFYNNVADDGGAIYNDFNDSLTIIECDFKNNTPNDFD